MIISLKWLKEYVDLEGISADEIVDKLTTSGSEVEEVIDKVSELKNIVVGYVEKVEKHPNADRLSLCKVYDGNETFNVVCGAPNVAEGQKVAFAKIGAIIPNGSFEIKKSKIRGEESSGMICAEDELGLSDDHTGIMVLNEIVKVGTPLAAALNYDDVILDIAITPNRSDSLSHIGIARDVAALFNRKLLTPDVHVNYKTVSKNDFAEVIIENTSDCPRYSAIVVRNIDVSESPEWLKKKLTSIGLRPINNVVDITNFVLYEMGQPLHAFDLDLLSENKIIVKNYDEEFKFMTLDSKERSILPTDLMICDANKPVAIAGVMGGENSEVSINTKNILIESAFFDPSSVRKTSKHLSLSTDASYRFERGTDPDITVKAALRAAQLIEELAGGDIIPEIIDVYPNKISQLELSVRYERINKILGFKIENDIVEKILAGLDFEIIKKDDEKITIIVPTFRHDIEREIDLIEEIVRIYGFDGIPPIDHISIALNKRIDLTENDDKLRNKLVSMGFIENISNSLLSDDKTIDYARSIKVLNPQSREMSRLRTSLIPGMLQNISRNIKVKESDLRLFEIGKVFSKVQNEIKSFDDFIEHENVVIALTGNLVKKEWYQSKLKSDYYHLVGIVNHIVDDYDNSKIKQTYNLNGDQIFEYKKEIIKNSGSLGIIGKVNTELLSKFDIEQDVFLAELNLSELFNLPLIQKKYNPLLKYPKVFRDFGFILDEKIEYETVVKTILDSSSKLLKKVNLFDIFISESIGAGKKSLAFELEYYDETRTLREEEVDGEFWKTIEAVKGKLKAELRG